MNGSVLAWITPAEYERVWKLAYECPFAVNAAGRRLGRDDYRRGLLFEDLLRSKAEVKRIMAKMKAEKETMSKSDRRSRPTG